MARKDRPESSSAINPLDVSVVVVSFNTAHLVKQCLESLEHSFRMSPGLTYETWVVDNASCDGTPQLVAQQFPDVKVIANGTNRGFAAANNQALQNCAGRLVLLLNPDTIVKDDAIAKMVAFLDQRPQVGIVGCQLLYEDGSFQHSSFHFPTLAMTYLDLFPTNHRLTDSRLNGRYRPTQYVKPFSIDHPLGACMLIRREVLNQIGLLDEEFFIYCEEIDFCLRARKAGWEIYCVPAAKVVHLSARSTSQYAGPMLLELYRSRYLLFQKHYNRTFQWLNRQIIRRGFSHKMAQTRRQMAQGLLNETEAEKQLAVYAEIIKL